MNSNRIILKSLSPRNWRWLLLGGVVLILSVASFGCDISPVPTPIPANEGGEFDDYDEFGGVSNAESMDNSLYEESEEPTLGRTPAAPDNSPEEETNEQIDEGGSSDEGAAEGGGFTEEGGEATAGGEESGGEEGGGEVSSEEDASTPPKDVCGSEDEDIYDEMDAGSLEDDDDGSSADECW